MAGTLGSYGSTICKTPNADALAREGVRFDNAYAACPICTPARASIQTGMYPIHHGMQNNIYNRGCMVHELPDTPGLLSRRLQRQGYRIGYTGKWHLGFGQEAAGQEEYEGHICAVPMLAHARKGGTLPSDIGYHGDDFPGHGGTGMGMPQYRQYLKDKGIELRTRKLIDYYPDTFEVLSGSESTVSWFLADQAIRHMTELRAEGDEPFFYMLNFWGPHSPYHASSEYLDMYRETTIPPWPSYSEDLTDKPHIHFAHRTERLRYWKWQDFEQHLRYYFAAVTEIDAMVGRVVDHLKQTGEYDNTVILFSSDHGDSLGIHGGLSDKALFMYEETNRVPLIVRDPTAPAHQAGRTESRFAGTCDLYSTVLEYAGCARASTEIDGKSLLPLIKDESVQWRDCMVTECSGLDYLLHTQRALRYQHFKYVFNCGDMDELYDLESDPHEMYNLATSPEHAATLKRMRIRLDAWMGEMNDGLQERYRRLRGLV